MYTYVLTYFFYHLGWNNESENDVLQPTRVEESWDTWGGWGRGWAGPRCAMKLTT